MYLRKIALSVISFFGFLQTKGVVYAQSQAHIDAQSNPGPAGLSQLQQLIQRIINLSVELAFVALLLMLVWGGIKLIISGGDMKAVQEAKQIFVWAVVGILFLIVAWLVLIIIHALTGVDVTQFCIGFPGASTGC